MRHYPDINDKYDAEEIARIQPEPWMLDQLKLNPSYVSWGPHEDYMWTKGEGWNSPVLTETWKEFELGLDDLNEVVNFYFEVNRHSDTCDMCGGNGYHPDAQWISESFYSHFSPFTHPTLDQLKAKAVMASFGGPEPLHIHGYNAMPPDDVLQRYGQPFRDFCIRTVKRGGHWSDDITEDEAKSLVEHGRGRDMKTAAEFNKANGPNGRGFDSHDAINRGILIEQRCKRLGIPRTCPRCDGYGYLYSGQAYVTLILWVLHPRKGCSRGWEVKRVDREDLEAIYTFLRMAAERNADRFSKIPTLEPKDEVREEPR